LENAPGALPLHRLDANTAILPFIRPSELVETVSDDPFLLYVNCELLLLEAPTRLLAIGLANPVVAVADLKRIAASDVLDQTLLVPA
jgi:hypothetical protein